MSERSVIVIGAGLSGLAVGARLASAGHDVRVLEGGDRAGGQIQTFREDGLVIELGAEGFVARSRAVPALCELLAIEDSLVDQLTTDTYAVEPSGLVLLPPGEAAQRLGFQVPVEELGRGIRSLAAGMGQLIDALAERVGSSLRLGTRVESLGRDGDLLQVELESGGREHARALVLAVPAPIAARLVQPLLPAAGSALASARLLSNVSVNLLYTAEQFRDYPAGSGLIFPENLASVGLRALSLVDHKFARRVSAEQALLRVFFRPPPGALDTWDDERFVSEAVRAIGSVLGVNGAPARTWVSRWADALPVFTPEYRRAVADADSELQARGIHLTGSAFHGAGIDAAVASAERVAARLLG